MSASIVADVLLSSGKLAKENVHLKANELKTKVEDTKLEIQEVLKSHHIDFSSQYLKLDKLIESLNNVSADYDNLYNQIENEIKPQMRSSVVEFNDVLEDLKRTKKMKAVALSLAAMHQHLTDAKKAMSMNSLLKAANHFISLESVIKEVKVSDQNDIKTILSLRTDSFITKESFISTLENLWQEKVHISTSMEGKKKCFSIKFSRLQSKEDDVELLIALNLMKVLRQVLQEFGNKFLSLIVDAILTKNVLVKRLEDSSCLTVTVTKDHTSELSVVFDKLKEVLMFLDEELFKLPIESKDNETTPSVMHEFGVLMGEEFCAMIIERRLRAAIPKKSKDLDSFRQDMSAAENFCNVLQTLEFIPSTGSKLHKFMCDIDILPVNKISQDFLSRARSLIQNSLHQVVTVGEIDTPVCETDNSSDLNQSTIAKNGLHKSTFSFPRCQISESIKNLIQLLYEVKNEACNIGPVHASKLYYVARNICELYCSVAPIYHKEEITNIPQQTAIYHNNCMYLAHRLATLGTHYEIDLQTEIRMTFVDLVQEIRKLGAEAFLQQMRHQRQQLLQLMQEQLAYDTIMLDDGVVNKAEKAIRQCLYQLQLLKKVWSHFLPLEVYFKSIGTLLNTCLEEIIGRILSMEDIAAEAASRLDSIFNIVLKEGPDLFKTSTANKTNEIHHYSKHWYKFRELQIVLCASMREIIDRWASGKGPLAAHFTSEETKHLIRALFQNTERRAAALAKIRSSNV